MISQYLQAFCGWEYSEFLEDIFAKSSKILPLKCWLILFFRLFWKRSYRIRCFAKPLKRKGKWDHKPPFSQPIFKLNIIMSHSFSGNIFFLHQKEKYPDQAPISPKTYFYEDQKIFYGRGSRFWGKEVQREPLEEKKLLWSIAKSCLIE